MADYYNDQQEIDSMGVLNTPVDSGMDAISINNETSSDLNNNLGGLRSAINGLSHQVTSLAKSTLQMGKDVGQSLTKDFYIEKEGGMMRAAAAMTGPIGAIAAKAINDSGVGDKIAGSVKSGLSKGVGVIGNKVRSMFGGRSRYDSQSGMLSPMTMSKISANGTETMVKEMNHGVTTPLIEANKYHKEHLNETKRGNQSIVRSIEDLGDTLTGVQNKRTGAKSNLQKQQEAELSHRRSDYGKTHAKSVKVPEQVVSTGSSTVSSNSDNTAVIEAINNLGSKFEEFSDPSANKGGGLLRTVGGLAFAFSGLDALFRGRYANDITKNKNPLITITDAQIQIYRWTRLYGELQKRQLNEIIKKLGGQQKEVVGKRGWLWESGAAKQWADELSEKGGFFNKLGSFALKAGSFLNYDPEEYLNERVAKAEKGREKLSQRKQKMGGVGEFFSTINTDMSDKQVDEGVERLHNRRRRGYDEKGNRQFAKGGWITKPVLIDDGSTVSKTKMFKDGGFIPPAIAGEAGKEGIVPISKEKGNLTTKLASTISDIIFERAKDHVTKGKKDPIPGILIEISKNVKSLEKNSHKSTKSIGEIAKAEKEENDTHNAEEFKKQSDERFKSSQKKDKGSKGIFGALGGIGNFFMKHPMLVAGALAMLMFPGATKAFGGWMMGGVDKFAKGLTMIGKGKKTIVNTGKALVKTAGHAAKVAAHGAKSGAGVMKGLQAGFKTTGIVKAVRSVSALMKGGKGLFGAIGGVAAKSIGKTVAKGGMKALFKRIPIVGSVLSILFAINRFKKGEIRGGIIECLSGLAGLLDLIAPGVGTGVSLLLDILNVFLDSKMKKNPMDGIKQPKKQEMSTGKKVLRGLPFIGGFVRLYDSFGHFKNKKWGKGLYDLATGLGGMVDFVIPGAGTGIMLLSDLVKHFVGGKDEAEGTKKKTDAKKQKSGLGNVKTAADHAKKGNKIRAGYYGIKGAKELGDATKTEKVEPITQKAPKPTQSGTVTINGREVKVTKNSDGSITRKSNAVTTSDSGPSQNALVQQKAAEIARRHLKEGNTKGGWIRAQRELDAYLDEQNITGHNRKVARIFASTEYQRVIKTGKSSEEARKQLLEKARKEKDKKQFESKFASGGFDGKFATKTTNSVDGAGNPIQYGEAGTEAIMPLKAKPGNLLSNVAAETKRILSGKGPSGPVSMGNGKGGGSVHAGDSASKPMTRMMAVELAKAIAGPGKLAKGGFTDKDINNKALKEMATAYYRVAYDNGKTKRENLGRIGDPTKKKEFKINDLLQEFIKQYTETIGHKPDKNTIQNMFRILSSGSRDGAFGLPQKLAKGGFTDKDYLLDLLRGYWGAASEIGSKYSTDLSGMSEALNKIKALKEQAKKDFPESSHKSALKVISAAFHKSYNSGMKTPAPFAKGGFVKRFADGGFVKEKKWSGSVSLKVTPGSSKKKAGLLPVSSKALSKEELDKKYRKQLADKIREISKDEGFVKQYKDDITSTVRNPSFTLQEKLSKLSGMWEDWNVFKNGGKINTNVKDENLKKKLEFQKAVNKAEAAKMYSSKIQSIEDKAAKATEDQKKDTKSKTIKAPVYGKAKDISSMLGEMEYAKIPYGNATIVKERRSNTVIGNDVTGIKEDVVRDVYQKYYQSGKYKKDPVVQSASVNVGNAQIVKRTHKSGRNTSLNSSIWYSPEYGLWTESKNESAAKKAEFEARFTGKQAPTTVQKAQSASKGVTAKATEVNKKPSIFTRATNWLKEKLFSSKSSTVTKKKTSSFNKMTASEKLRRAKAAKDFKGTGAIAGDKKDDKQQLFKEVKEAARNKVPSFIVDQLISDYTRSHDLDWGEEEFLEMKAKMIYNQELVNNDPTSKKQTYTDKNGNKVTKVSGSISQIDLTKKWNQTTKDAKVSGDTVSIGPYQFSKKFYDSVMDEAKNGARSISYEQLIKDFSGNNSADPFDDGGAFYSDAHKVLKSVEKKTKSDTSISAVAQKVLYDKASKKYYDERNNYYNEVIKKGKAQSASKGVTAKATEVNKSNTKSQPETIDESKRLDSKRLDEIKSTQKLEATNKVYAHRKANEDLKSSVEDGTKKTVNASNVTANKIVKSVNNQTIINQANKESNPADFYTPLAGVNTSNLI